MTAVWHREAGWERKGGEGAGDSSSPLLVFYFILSTAVESLDFLCPVSLASAVFSCASLTLLCHLYP